MGWIAEDSPAVEAGFQQGDQILTIQGTEVSDWEDAKILFASNPDERLRVDILREGTPLTLEVVPESEGPRGGFTGLLHDMPAVVGAVAPGMPAVEAGIQEGDRILSIDGGPVSQWDQMARIIRDHPDVPLQITFQRGEEVHSVRITPEPFQDQRAPSFLGRAIAFLMEKLGMEREAESEDTQEESFGRIGIEYTEETLFKRYGLWESIKNGFQHIGKIMALTFYVLGKLVTGGLSAKTLGGPILIAKMTGDAARVGLASLLSFTAFLSLQLGILNLMPIPVLDGGHVLFLSLEAILRKPVNAKIRDLAQQVGFFLLLGFILYISYNDVMRLVH